MTDQSDQGWDSGGTGGCRSLEKELDPNFQVRKGFLEEGTAELSHKGPVRDSHENQEGEWCSFANVLSGERVQPGDKECALSVPWAHFPLPEHVFLILSSQSLVLAKRMGYEKRSNRQRGQHEQGQR